jgi:hypothetical protein
VPKGGLIMVIKIDKVINESKLMDELLKLNLISPTKNDGTSTLQSNELYVEKEINLPAIQDIINKHDPTRVPQPLQPTTQDLQKQLFDLTTQLVIGGVL